MSKPEPGVPEQMVRGLGIAPALVAHDVATDNLVAEIREQTDDVVKRAKAAVEAEKLENRRPG